ncbi:MAG: MmcQ/YjbR family DNA-binding protein [Pseudomonadota bacterium]
MTPEAFEAACLALPGTDKAFPFGEGMPIYRVSEKMFAAQGGRSDRFRFKCSDDAFRLLIDAGLTEPAPYLQRAKWVAIDQDALPEDEIRQRLAMAYAIVRGKLPKKQQAALPPFDQDKAQ